MINRIGKININLDNGTVVFCYRNKKVRVYTLNSIHRINTLIRVLYQYNPHIELYFDGSFWFYL